MRLARCRMDQTLVSLSQTFLDKVADRTLVVGVIGLGYVGLPFAVEAAKEGFHVIGVDLNPEKCSQVNRGENYIGDVEGHELKELVEKGLITAVSNFDRVPEMDAVIIAVPTPLDKNLIPDMSYVESVSKALNGKVRPGQLISLESTTYPGTTEEIIQPHVEAGSSLQAERDYFLAHSPERVDPGNPQFKTKNTAKVVGGVGPESLKVACAFYGAVVDKVVPVSTARAAELTKVFENTFRAVNIALVNELMVLCDKMDINVWEVLDAANTKPFGIMRFMPGPGVGGHCIPLDPHYLEWKARQFNFRTRFIDLAGEINRSMPAYVVARAARLLNSAQKSMKGSKVLVLGVAYKKDIDDWRESPAIEVMKLLEETGADVSYHDPYIPEFEDHGYARKGIELTDEALANADLVVITTSHKSVDYERVVRLSPRILDTRYAAVGLEGSDEKVTLL